MYLTNLWIGIVLAYFVAGASPTMDVANAVLPTYVTFLLFFGGFILDFRTMPSYWKWFSYLDFIRYAWSALMINQFEAYDPPNFLGNSTVLEHYGLKNYRDHSSAHYGWYTPTVNKWANLGFLYLFFAGFFCLAWYVLKTKTYNVR